MKKNILLYIVSLVMPALAIAQPGTKHILLEEFSTAPCGFCPDGDLIAADIVKNHPRVIWVTHHAGFGTDSMTVPESSTIAAAFTTGAPMAPIDRGDYKIPVYTISPYIAVSRQKWDSICVAHLNDAPVATLDMTNTYNSSTGTLSTFVTVWFNTMPAAGDMRVNLYLVEDSVVGAGKGYDQKNYFNGTTGHPFYQKGDEIPGYVHHHVMRKVAGGAWGVAGILPSAPVIGTPYSYTFSNMAIPSTWKAADMDVVAFVSYHHSNAAMRPVLNSFHKKMLDNSPAGVESAMAVRQRFTVFPNPASDRVYVSGDIEPQSTLEITTISGQVVGSFRLSQGSMEFPLAGLSNGMYVYKIQGTRTVEQGKLLIVH